MDANKKSNLIVAGVVGVLVVAVVVIFVAASSGGGGGGGGGAAPSVPVAETPDEAVNQPSTDPGVVDPVKATPTPPKDISQVTLDQPFDAATSPDVPTVTEVRANLKARGFEDAALTMLYQPDGTHNSNIGISYDSASKYPQYILSYQANSGIEWAIYVHNGNYYASPLNLFSSTGADVMYSESDYIIGYLGSSNTYTYTVPNTPELVIQKVSNIDRALLDRITAEEIGQL